MAGSAGFTIHDKTADVAKPTSGAVHHHVDALACSFNQDMKQEQTDERDAVLAYTSSVPDQQFMYPGGRLQIYPCNAKYVVNAVFARQRQ